MADIPFFLRNGIRTDQIEHPGTWYILHFFGCLSLYLLTPFSPFFSSLFLSLSFSLILSVYLCLSLSLSPSLSLSISLSLSLSHSLCISLSVCLSLSLSISLSLSLSYFICRPPPFFPLHIALHSNYQELELEIEDLEEVYPAFRSAITSLSSAVASSPTIVEGDIHDSSQDTYEHHQQQNLSSCDGDCGGVGQDDIVEISHVEDSAVLDSKERELVDDDRDSLISQVKVQCVVLGCAGLCCVVLCCVVLCCVVLR